MTKPLCDASIIDADNEELSKAVSKSPKRIRTVAINKVPNLFPTEDQSDERNALAELVSARPDVQERVGQALANRYADSKVPEHVQQQIYAGGFYSSSDKQLLDDWKTSNWQRRADLVGQSEDQRLKQFGMRLIFWNPPKHASQVYQSSARTAVWDCWSSNEPDAPWTTKAAVDLQLDEIEAAEAMGRDRLTELRKFYRQRFSEIS